MTRFIRLFFSIVLLCAASQGLAAEAMVDTTAVSDTTAIADPSLIPANSTGDLDFAMDVGGFKGVDGQTYTELYLLLRPSQFTLAEQKNKIYKGEFQIAVTIYDREEMAVHQVTEQRVYETDQPVLISRSGQERVMMDLIAVSLDPGTYRAEVLLSDLNSEIEGVCSKPFVADPYSETRFAISDVQFSTKVQVDSTTHRFTKNGLLVLPNPARTFEKWVELPSDSTYKPKIMYFYFEIYNFADRPDGESSTYDINYAVISHASGRKFPMPAQKNLVKPGSSGMKVLALDFSTFPQDIYTLELTVRDNVTGETVTRQRIFEVVQPPPPPPPVTVLTEEQAERGYKMLKVIASKRDLNVYKKLDLVGKTEFLINYWKSRDPTPDTPENEFMIVFNEQFSFAEYQLGGADSDMGRVFMKYGEAEEIERHDNEPGMKPYIIWYYTSGSGIQSDASRQMEGGRDFFVFGDQGGFGRYRLLHSTASNTNYNPDWRRQLSITNPDQIGPDTSIPLRQ